MFLSKKSFLRLANVRLGFIPLVQSPRVPTCAGVFAAAESASRSDWSRCVCKITLLLQLFSKSVNLRKTDFKTATTVTLVSIRLIIPVRHKAVILDDAFDELACRSATVENLSIVLSLLSLFFKTWCIGMIVCLLRVTWHSQEEIKVLSGHNPPVVFLFRGLFMQAAVNFKLGLPP